jgi:hypothetical protein
MSSITFAPACPHPHPPTTKESRIKMLKGHSEGTTAKPAEASFYETSRQPRKVNYYVRDRRDLTRRRSLLMNGRVVKKEDRFQRAEGPRWHEV